MASPSRLNSDIQLDPCAEPLAPAPMPTISTTTMPGIPQDKFDDEMNNEEGTIEYNIEIEFPQSRVLRIDGQLNNNVIYLH